MGCTLYRKGLRGRTEEYWEGRFDYDCYIEQLLGVELTYARDNPLPDGTPRLRQIHNLHALAMTVGETFEPLLQAVCVLQPRRLILVLNKSYGTTPGRDHGSSLCRSIEHLKTVDLPDCFRPIVSGVTPIVLDEDTPTDTFRALQQAFRHPESQPPPGWVNAVDITGAKKSMVVGAFLYAAHSDLPITYVDFEEYNSDFGKPYGYLCKIGQIADPYQAFQLRDWEQVRQLYNSCNFRRARQMIGHAVEEDRPGSGILGAMSGHLGDGKADRSLYAPSDIERVDRLVRLLLVYEEWDNGEYRRARDQLNEFEPPLPADVMPWAVWELGSNWPSAAGVDDPGQAAKKLLDEHLELKRGKTGPEDSIFDQPVRLLAYVQDELAKIGRLLEHDEDYRSAFLRAAGLEELLLKARWCLCFLGNELDLVDRQAPAVRPGSLSPAEASRWFRALVEYSGADVMRDVLVQRRPLFLERLDGQATLKAKPTIDVPQLQKYWADSALDFDHLRTPHREVVFTKLRGEAIHTHLYIPLAVAKAALDLVQVSVHEFERNWLEHFHPGATRIAEGKPMDAPSWKRLCEACDLDFLPPRLRD